MRALIVILIALNFVIAALYSEKIPECMLNYKFGQENYILIVDKSKQKLFVYSNYSSTPVDEFLITTGKVKGRKKYEGDMKTPEGLYFFTRVLEGDELPKVDDYGEKAFVMNYPNPFDRFENRSGSGIWLHGAFNLNKLDLPNNTRGCVALKNSDLVRISKYIFLNKTPICIYNKIKYEDVENIKKKRKIFLEYIKKWKWSWEEKAIDEYVSFYTNSFRYKGMNIREFKNYKSRLNKIYKYIRVFLYNIDVYSYKDYYIAQFNQLYISDKNQFYTRKFQYWINRDKFRIVDEKTFSLSVPNKFEITKGNFIRINEYRKNIKFYDSKLREKPGFKIEKLPKFKEEPVFEEKKIINLKNITINRVVIGENSIVIKYSNSNLDYKIIPVIHLLGSKSSKYKTLNSIKLKNGIPQNPENGLKIDKTSQIEIIKSKQERVKSITTFIVNSKNEFISIITNFIR